MTVDRRTFLVAGGTTMAGLFTAEASAEEQPTDPTVAAQGFITAHETKLRPLDISAGKAWWTANITGEDKDFKAKEEAQNKIDAVLSDPKPFAVLKGIKAANDAGKIEDPLLKRQINLLYLAYLEKQVPADLLKRITAKANSVEQTFNVYRAKIDGQEFADSKVRSTLKQSTDSGLRKKVWEASKGVGAAVENDLRELVTLRNEAATKLGFKNYHEMMLTLNEQDGKALVGLFDELNELTKKPFTDAKAEIDVRLAKNYGVNAGELMPWHYHDPFFQESPTVFDANLDAPFAKADIPKLCATFYTSIGLPVDRVLANSDLFEKKGKSPHAFCTDIDREGDVRVLANIVPNEYWMGTMLHELGHAVYSSINIPMKLPYLLRGEAHILATEGVAMQFERFSKSRTWIERMGLRVENAKAFDEAAAKTQRNQLLIFSRWCQVMLRFEKAMYENPGQDLNKLWWDLVEQYQQVKRPQGRSAPDYAAKIHICSAPVYYHNYMMGQLFASQVHHSVAQEVFKSDTPKSVIYNDNKAVGTFMKERVFAPGRTLNWNGLTKHATGAELNAKAFASDFQS